jgi:hypothetical protein
MLSIGTNTKFILPATLTHSLGKPDRVFEDEPSDYVPNRVDGFSLKMFKQFCEIREKRSFLLHVLLNCPIFFRIIKFTIGSRPTLTMMTKVKRN